MTTATDTMTGTAHMLSDCVPSMTTATPSVGMCNGECFMFYVSHTGVRALRVLSASRPEFVPMTGSAGTMTHTEAVRVDIMCNGHANTHTLQRY